MLTVAAVYFLHCLVFHVMNVPLFIYPNHHEGPFGSFLPIMRSAAMSILISSRRDLVHLISPLLY